MYTNVEFIKFTNLYTHIEDVYYLASLLQFIRNKVSLIKTTAFITNFRNFNLSVDD